MLFEKKNYERFIEFIVVTIQKYSLIEQESIPVGCVPSAFVVPGGIGYIPYPTERHGTRDTMNHEGVLWLQKKHFKMNFQVKIGEIIKARKKPILSKAV